MKRLVLLLGALVLLGWTGLGVVAWVNVARQASEGATGREVKPSEAAELQALSDELAAVHEDLRGLAARLGENLQALHDGLDEGAQERHAAVERELAALREELRAQTALYGALQGELAALRAGAAAPTAQVPSAAGAAPPATSPAVVQSAPPEPEKEKAKDPAPPAAEPGKKKSFLAFQLPSDEFRFDQRSKWTVLPALSRVGFDGKSTLHDFSGATSRLTGELEVDPSRPAETPHARIVVQAASLDSGEAGRDEDMRKALDVEAHPELVFELERFEAGTVDAAAKRVEGTAVGKLTIRGATRPVSMPVKLSVDDTHRLAVQGEVVVRLPDFGVPVPSKLGLISMDPEVKIWIALRLRASARTE